MSIFDASEAGAPPIESDDPVCQTCGKALYYAGKGRKPKYCDEHKRSSSSSTGTRASTSAKGVEQAVESLEQLYGVGAMALMFLSPEAAHVWNDQIAALSDRNRQHLKNSPDLVKRINDTAGKGGSFAFALSHVFAMTPPMIVLYAELNRRPRRAKPAPPPPVDNTPPWVQDYDVPNDASSIDDMPDVDPIPADVDPLEDQDAAFKRNNS